MSNILEKSFLEFHKVVRGHISGEVDKFTTFCCNVSSRLRIPKIIEIGSRLTKRWQFFGTQCIVIFPHTIRSVLLFSSGDPLKHSQLYDTWNSIN